jgi:hypothetical protein
MEESLITLHGLDRSVPLTKDEVTSKRLVTTTLQNLF